jgi:hypothetical protein
VCWFWLDNVLPSRATGYIKVQKRGIKFAIEMHGLDHTQ